MIDKFDAAKVWSELLSANAMRPNVLMGVPTVYSKLVEEFDRSYDKVPSKVEFVKSTCINKMRL